MKKTTVYDCNVIELPKHHSDRKGNISVVENFDTVPFDVKRIYYLYDIPGGEERGAHAHKALYQLIVAASGSFTVTLDDGNVKRTVLLNRPYQGLMVVPGIWRTLDDFSSGSVCMVLASEGYDANDYIRTYEDFLEYKNHPSRVHPLANCMSANVGENTNIWQYCVIFPQAEIGDNCNVCANVLIENRVKIGNNVTIKSGVQVWDGITLEDNVFIGPNVTFTNDSVPRSKAHRDFYGTIIVKKGASIGANSTLIADVEIGEYAFIGAGSVVTKDIPPYTVWYGNPATQRGFITKEGILLDMEKKDKQGNKYEI